MLDVEKRRDSRREKGRPIQVLCAAADTPSGIGKRSRLLVLGKAMAATGHEEESRIMGRGLNSIRWRFAVACAVLTAVAIVAREMVLGHHLDMDVGDLLSIAMVITLSGSATFWMASQLTRSIKSLQRSTEAIAAGEFDSPVNVDCTCEVGGLAESFQKMTARLNANILRINTLAYTDPITGLPNRAAIDHLLHYALAPERVGQFRAAIVFVDLDGFKRINDTLGHDGGDVLLKLAGQRILEQGLGRTLQTLDTCTDPFGNPCNRLPVDIVFARFAGDEFVAVLPGLTDRAALAQVGHSIIASLQLPFRVKNQDVTVGASIGIAIAPDDTTSAAELLTFADQAMYSSKQAGRSRHRFFDRDIRQAILDRARTEAELRLAIPRGELLLHYQPKLDAQTLALSGVEALVRWQHPQRGLLLPGEFIELAEQSGQMAALGRRVLELAVAQCRVWLDQGLRRAVAVNVSPSQFADPEFVPNLLALLAQAGVPATLFSVEITESIAMTDFAATAHRLMQLREAGVRVAVDDFGIGFSNLSQLSRLPIDELKIDRSLVTQIGHGDKGEAIIRAIVSMSRALGYKNVAEGIETHEQQVFLQQLECSTLQGFLFARPMAAEQLQTWELQQSAIEAG